MHCQGSWDCCELLCLTESLAEVVGWGHNLYEIRTTLTDPSDRLACKCDSRDANVIRGDVKMKDQIERPLQVTSKLPPGARFASSQIS